MLLTLVPQILQLLETEDDLQSGTGVESDVLEEHILVNVRSSALPTNNTPISMIVRTLEPLKLELGNVS